MKAGDVIEVVDSHSVHHQALITIVHDGGTGEPGPWAINVAYVTDDAAKTDPYGRQIERMTSVPAKSKHSAAGYFYLLPE